MVWRSTTSIGVVGQITTGWTNMFEVINDLFVQELNLRHWVLVFNVTNGQVNFIIRTEIVPVFVLRHLILDFNTTGNRSFINPTPWHISQGITATSREDQWNSPSPNELDTLSMALD
jgi:hypothetical protein